jgi:hypothetical protein
MLKLIFTLLLLAYGTDAWARQCTTTCTTVGNYTTCQQNCW